MATPRAELDPTYVAENVLARWLGITGTFTVLATIIVLMRIYIRAWMVKSFGYDDWFMVVAMVRVSPLSSRCFVLLPLKNAYPMKQIH